MTLDHKDDCLQRLSFIEPSAAIPRNALAPHRRLVRPVANPVKVAVMAVLVPPGSLPAPVNGKYERVRLTSLYLYISSQKHIYLDT